MVEKITWSTKDDVIWSNVERLAAKAGWRDAELARQAKTNPQYIIKVRSHTRGIGKVMQKRFAEAFGIDEAILLLPSAMNVPEKQNRLIPIISWVHAGAFAEPIDQWPAGVSGEGDPVPSYITVGPHAFGLKIQGDSMAPRYLPGDTIIVDPEIRCDNGSPCVVWVNGEVSLKFFHEDEKEIRLVPMNEAYEIRVIPKGRKVDFRVIGKVVELIPANLNQRKENGR